MSFENYLQHSLQFVQLRMLQTRLRPLRLSTLNMTIRPIMKEAIVQPDLKVRIRTRNIPEPGPGQVLIQVKAMGTNPKDYKRPMAGKAHNSGDDVAGIVVKVGAEVTDFKAGDRVAAFHEMMAENGAFAEYSIAHDFATFMIPEKISFEQGATIPLAANTAAVGLFRELNLPPPWRPTMKPRPLIIYGGSGAVGLVIMSYAALNEPIPTDVFDSAFAIKLAKASNIHPLIVVAGKGHDFVESLIDRNKGDTIVDYRKGNESIVAGIKEAVENAGAKHVHDAFDAVGEKGSGENICAVLGKEGRFTTVLPLPKDFKVPENIKHTVTKCAVSFQASRGSPFAFPKEGSSEAEAGIVTGGSDFALVFFRLISRGLQQGWFTAHPHEIIPGGLEGVEAGLRKLKLGEASAVKYVYKL